MISTEQIKELRDKTGISVMQCRKALEEAGGDMEKALVILREKSGEIADKKSDRTLGAGVVAAYVHATGIMGAIVELNCETDFVAKNPEFKALAYDIAMHVAANAPTTVDELVLQPFVKNPEVTVADMVKGAVQKFGEKTVVGRFSRFSVLEK